MGERIIGELEPAEREEQQHGSGEGKFDERDAALIAPESAEGLQHAQLSSPHTTGGVLCSPKGWLRIAVATLIS